MRGERGKPSAEITRVKCSNVRENANFVAKVCKRSSNGRWKLPKCETVVGNAAGNSKLPKCVTVAENEGEDGQATVVENGGGGCVAVGENEG